ncbi:hypothetical protein DJ031_15180 [bacterium endosymbiont of Escarpia laminata]|nr:MAG: hypothetical protein DJ031_15180 [bacterium endosymbiont of Escarpia laminata]
MRRVSVLCMCLLIVSAATVGDVANTVHNLSSSGPGTGAFKSLTEDRICIFCHTPHAATPETPLWNRLSTGAYTPYQSSTTDAAAGNMSSSSDLCLSCHDGTIALGDLVNPGAGVTNDLSTTFLTGRALIGSDLSNDHPVAIIYDPNLLATDPDLLSPAVVDLPLKNGELHCSSCHDPHKNIHPPFLHKPTLNGELCITCHIPTGPTWDWTTSSHATSLASPPMGTDPWAERKPAWVGQNVRENACMNCHTPHNAATPVRLIKDQEEQTCYLCHDGTVAQDILSEELKFSHHPVEMTPNLDHDSVRAENPLTMSFHVECEDCHNPHGSYSSPPMISFNPANPADTNHTTAPFVNGSMVGVTGIDSGGAVKPEVDYEYEVCFKCHGVPGKSACDNQRCSTATGYSMTRQDGVYNLRDKVDPGNPALVSYHPITANDPFNNGEVPSLRTDIPLDTSSSLIYCSDCHSSNVSPAAGGVGTAGSHGSTFEGILALPYDFDPQTATSANNLCYKCHNAASLEVSFIHSKHVGANTTCINCHDPHGSTKFPHLLNFLTFANVTGPMEITGTGAFTEPTWVDNGQYSGACYLVCHGKTHDGWSYPP